LRWLVLAQFFFFINLKFFSMKIVVRRQFSNQNQTLGQLSVINDNDVEIFVCKTLELPFLGNKRRISAIPCGKYEVKQRYSSKYGYHLSVLNVPNRDNILIHQGNFFSDILGCILVGTHLQDIGKGSDLDILRSRDTLKLLVSLLPDTTTLIVCNDATFINVNF
jgi:hypothetical protein